MHVDKRTLIYKTIIIICLISLIILSLSVTFVSKGAWGITDNQYQTFNNILDIFKKGMDFIPKPQNDLNAPLSQQPDPQYNPYSQPYQLSPSDPTNLGSTFGIQQQLTQFWTQFENQLVILSPYEQQYALSYAREIIGLQLSPYSPDQQQEAITELRETMSPELADLLLF